MKFWDSSSIVSLLSDEPTRPILAAIRKADSAITVWWGTSVEVISAVARRKRAGGLSTDAEDALSAEFRAVAASWEEIVPATDVRDAAEQLLWKHPLRAGDALQLAAALAAADGTPGTLDFVCLDQRLSDAARREGFKILP